ncbi:DUF1002 domain-containing protein [Romboutsia lituseburensis]|uniref:Uncharacterized protein YpuA, DUF1002 family n=1 Tax=Romboutsia lituseburensis DSM 797 TaxID=1121325 RepID=A0A1G9KHU6_9FIRM|nr:DUF1002 domain-containing protein [Romboutsia lituseburensis]CEH34908.1 Signal peptide protein, YSIRK [Romboutsia lituseburensis]SDL49114.1 Uncharacterized protein YpuA, DUF1002 family [Romboutsia lituseburensis DSM 797]
MNKVFKNFRKKATTLTLAAVLSLSTLTLSFADSSKVVTLGANLKPEQKQQMLKYFGVNDNEAVVLDVNNQEERKYLQGVASEEQLGKITISCSYVEPTTKGNGINVKTANLTWVTSSMIATTLSTAGIENANVIAAAPFPVSGTGALTGVMKAFEDATGKPLPEDKKELATEELITTGDLGDEVGQDKATGVINDIKSEIIKNGTKDTVQIADTINNITNNYNINLTDEQFKKIEDLMLKISQQDYEYNKIKDTLANVSDNVDKNLSALGENVGNSGLFDSIGDFFGGIGEWFGNLFNSNSKDLGILENTNDELLGSNAQIDATDDKAINMPSSEEVEGFFAKVWNWFTGLFNSNSENKTNDSNVNSTPEQNNAIEPKDDASKNLNNQDSSLEQNTPTSNTEDKKETQQPSVDENSSPVENNTQEQNSQDNNQTSEIPPAQ